MKGGDTVARDVLRLALGEIQTAEARKNSPLTDEEAAAVVRKLIKSNEETLGLAASVAQGATLREEIDTLASLLPKPLSVEEIVAALSSEHAAIKAAKSDGQATGLAMKHLRASGKAVSGNEVGAAIRAIRGG